MFTFCSFYGIISLRISQTHFYIRRIIMAKRVFLIVLDSFGVGAEPDAPLFGDPGTNTLGAIAGHPNFKGDNLAKLGMFNLDGVTCGTPVSAPIGSYARLREASAGKTPPSAIGRLRVCSAQSHCPPSRTASRRSCWTSSPPRPATRFCATSPTPAPRSSATTARST